MDPDHRRIILQNKKELENNIDMKHLKMFLKKSKIFTWSMLKDIDEGKKNLFEELPSRGPEAFMKFIKALRDAGYGVIAERIHPGDSKNINSCRWVYGCCLIINNVDFSVDLPKRSNLEADTLQNCFPIEWGLDSIVMRNDVSGKYMLPILEELSNEIVDPKDICIVIILSHGEKRPNGHIVFGADGGTVLETDILKIFTRNKHLSNALKLFLLPSDGTFINSCEKVPNFEDMYSVRWPSIENNDNLFGEVLANCFKNCTSNTYGKIDLEGVVKNSFALFLDQ